MVELLRNTCYLGIALESAQLEGDNNNDGLCCFVFQVKIKVSVASTSCVTTVNLFDVLIMAKVIFFFENEKDLTFMSLSELQGVKA